MIALTDLGVVVARATDRRNGVFLDVLKAFGDRVEAFRCCGGLRTSNGRGVHRCDANRRLRAAGVMVVDL